ncbi:holo-ACP synthase [Intestinibacter sp.]|uniref:holo-ACP synthase n=1 Tax=Intestinibacter sp. TaxID=1965304 RepID=UPI002A74D9CB|nr:holo-ACP synthase [Intestinibacter sp.]MDY2735442.1 holo-ACP synthase [Intestinibacter sp.]MDY4574969.1 holo-ACP synthase [Intestinibacter sp.]
MNILGIGIDIIEIDRIEKVLERTPRFLERNFTEKEIEYFKANNLRSESIAGNFAAKEAISKAIGTGIRGFNLKDIEILRDDLGKPIVNTYNNLNDICIKYSVKEIKVSISHSENYAVANCLIITED